MTPPVPIDIEMICFKFSVLCLETIDRGTRQRPSLATKRYQQSEGGFSFVERTSLGSDPVRRVWFRCRLAISSVRTDTTRPLW